MRRKQGGSKKSLVVHLKKSVTRNERGMGPRVLSVAAQKSFKKNPKAVYHATIHVKAKVRVKTKSGKWSKKVKVIEGRVELSKKQYNKLKRDKSGKALGRAIHQKLAGELDDNDLVTQGSKKFIAESPQNRRQKGQPKKFKTRLLKPWGKAGYGEAKIVALESKTVLQVKLGKKRR